MSIPYSCEVSGYHSLIMRLPPDLEVVTGFLLSDVSAQPGASGTYVLRALDAVLSGQSPYDEGTGNVYTVRIWPDHTQITNETLPIDDDPELKEELEIDAAELRCLVAIWMDALRRFEETGEIPPASPPGQA